MMTAMPIMLGGIARKFCHVTIDDHMASLTVIFSFRYFWAYFPWDFSR